MSRSGKLPLHQNSRLGTKRRNFDLQVSRVILKHATKVDPIILPFVLLGERHLEYYQAQS